MQAAAVKSVRAELDAVHAADGEEGGVVEPALDGVETVVRRGAMEIDTVAIQAQVCVH